MSMSTEMMRRDPRVGALQAWLQSPAMIQQIRQALRTKVDPLTICRIAMTTAMRTPKLLDCTAQSFAGAIITACQMGLEPDNVTGLAYLVPYGNTVTLIPGYQGLIKLAYQSGKISLFEAHNVYSCEDYDVDYGASPPVRHKPSPPSTRGEYVASYAKVTMKDGAVYYEWMWAEEVAAIRDRSPAKGSGPWVTDTGQMRRKTVAKRACKYIPSSPTLQRAVALDDQADAKLDQSFIDLDIADAPGADDDGKSRTTKLGEAVKGEIDKATPKKAAPKKRPADKTPAKPVSEPEGEKGPDVPKTEEEVTTLRKQLKASILGMGEAERGPWLKMAGLSSLTDLDGMDGASLRSISEALP